jgi:hypothetical protein
MFVRLNEGTREKPEFSPVNIVVQAAGKELRLPCDKLGHAAPTVADWDGDGRWDILSGCVDGGVYFYRNTGELESPHFDEPQVLIAPHDGSGYDEILEIGAEPVPGIRTQIFAVDYFGIGKTDLLVGDFRTTLTFRADLTSEERQEFESLRKQVKETEAERRKLVSALREDLAKRFPGEAIDSDEAKAEFKRSVQVIHESPRYKAAEKRRDELDAATNKYLFRPRPKGRTPFQYANPHGYVWLFQRK